MSRSLNKAILIGNVGADPDVRTTAGGSRVASFSLATSRRWRTQAGGEQEKTDWHRVIAWDRLAEVADRFVRKGNRIYVEGRLEYRSWKDNSGHERHATEIIAEDVVLLGESGGTHTTDPATRQRARGAPSPSERPTGRPARNRNEDDDLPF